jgi:hypothetical protein
MSLNKLVEGIFKNICETTTSGDIAYLPGGYTTVKQTIASLVGLKNKWKIEVLENGDNYDLSFEDRLKVIIPKLHYAHFNEKVLKIDGVKEINLDGILIEAINSTFNVLSNTLITTLREIDVIQNTFGVYIFWLSNFKQTKISYFKNSLLSFQAYDRDIVGLLRTLKSKYGGDRGYLESLISAIGDQRDLSGIDYVNTFDYLLANYVQSDYLGIKLNLSLTVNLVFEPVQIVTINDVEILNELKFYKDIRVVKNQIYPINKIFRYYIFDIIKDVIEGVHS